MSFYDKGISQTNIFQTSPFGQEVFYATDQLEGTGYPCSGPL
jgi:hypothetical protein